MTAACPCGSALAYGACCGRYHAGPLHLQAPTAEALMRSRYSAYVLGLREYVLATWHTSKRPSMLDADPPGLKWLGLEVRRCQPLHSISGINSLNSLNSEQAIVEFVARSKLGGRAQRLHETSHFVREDGRWFYVDGDLR